MTATDIVLIFLCMLNGAALTTGGYLFAMIKINRAGMMKTSRDLESERLLLAEEMKKLAGMSHEIGSNWKALNDKVVTVENKLVAIQANLQSTSMNSFRSPGR